MITAPKVERRKKQNYVAIRMAVPIPFGKYLQPAWNEVQDWLKSKGIEHAGPAMIRYWTTDMSNELDIDVGFAVDKAMKSDDRITAGVIPAGKYATLLYTGPYRGTGVYKANVEMVEWAKQNKVKWSVKKKKGVEWWAGRVEWYLSDPTVEKDPKKYRTELTFMVK